MSAEIESIEDEASQLWFETDGMDLAREVIRLRRKVEAILAMPDTTEVVHIGRQSYAAQIRAAQFEGGYASCMKRVKEVAR